ncbi:MAG TPA: YtxH domain-containing protein [Woeseiaceae bacterium]|nr:YtxH domain-containing protein [Woeseiaceae bacterium]
MTDTPSGGMPPIQTGPSAQLAANPTDARGTSQREGDTRELVHDAKEQGQKITDQAADLFDEAKHQATDAMRSVKEKARDMAEEQKSAGAEQIKGVARAMQTAADELEQQMPAAAGYVREAASGVERFSSSLRNRSIDELVSSFNNFAKNQPTAFFGASVLAGFVLSRFLKSSAESGSGTGMQAHTPQQSGAWSSHYGGSAYGSGSNAGMTSRSPHASSPSGTSSVGTGSSSFSRPDKTSGEYGRL